MKKLTMFLRAGLCASVLSTNVFAFNAGEMNWEHLGHDFKIDNNKVTGSYRDQQKWKGTFCSGQSAYEAAVDAVIAKVDFALQEGNRMNATVDLNDVRVDLDGRYRSELTFCNTVRAGFPVFVESLQIRSRVVFEDGAEGSSPKIHVRIMSTHFGRIRFGGGMPAGLERFFTSVVNSGVQHMWASRLGEWLSDKLGDYLNDNFPKHG